MNRYEQILTDMNMFQKYVPDKMNDFHSGVSATVRAVAHQGVVKVFPELSNKNSAPSGGFQSHDLTVMNVYREV